MAKNKNKKGTTTENKTVVAPVVTSPVENESKQELVMSAGLELKDNSQKLINMSPQKNEKPEGYLSSHIVLTNASQNTICLTDGRLSLTFAPREIKKANREIVRELLKQKMVKRYFDKGIISSKEYADEVSASDAEVPQELKGAVEMHDSGQTISAEVKKFELDSKVNLNLI